ncbi:MAG: co-chaperone GroES [Lachnospiraceae bacterium]|nr:co-chaperone GroES [Lachnospiraceae bacterium]
MLRPLGDRLVLKQVVAEETTKSGIVLPGQSKEKPQEATVVAKGKAVESEYLNEGATVIYSKYAGNTIKIDEEEYIIVKEEDILAVVE